MIDTSPPWEIVDMELGVYEISVDDVAWRLWRHDDESYHLAPKADLQAARSISRLGGIYSVLDVAAAYIAARTDLKEKQ